MSGSPSRIDRNDKNPLMFGMGEDVVISANAVRRNLYAMMREISRFARNERDGAK
jgi:hypothetical protein